MNASTGRAAMQGLARVQNTSRRAEREALKSARHIELRGVPQSVTPSDIRRLVARSKLQGVSDVAIEYSHFMPTERALLTLTRPDYLQHNLRALDKATIAGIEIEAVPKLEAQGPLPRQRGGKGRQEAAERGLLTGDGPHAGLTNSERSVTIWGFPGKIAVDGVLPCLRGYKVKASEKGKPYINKILPPEGAFTMVSRFLVTLASVSEAHRLVREMHLTHWEPEKHGSRYLLRAKIIY